MVSRVEQDIVSVRMLVRVWHGLNWAVGGGSLAAGLLYLLGPPRFRDSYSFDVFAAVGLSDRIWPTLLVVAAVCVCAGSWTRTPWMPVMIGHVGCTVALGWFGFVSATAWFDPTQHTGGSPLLILALAAVHALAAYARLAQRRIEIGHR